MSSMFKSQRGLPQASPTEVPMVAPTRTAAEVQTLAAQQKERYNRSTGRATAMLTSGQGIDNSTLSTATTLLGNVGR